MSAAPTIVAADPPVTPTADRPRWCRATRALIAAGAAWWVLLAADRLLSGRWWFWLLPDLAPPLAYVAVPLLILAAVPVVGRLRQPLPARPRRFLVISMLLAVAAAVPQLGVVPLHRQTLTGTPIHAFSWNTEYWDQGSDPQALLDFLTAQHADVYLLQEHLYWDLDAGLAGAREVRDLDSLHKAFPGWSIAAVGELATLSRFPIVAQSAIGAPAGIESADYQTVFTAAKVLRTDLQVGGTVVSTYNVHLPVQVNLEASGRFLNFVAERNALRHGHLAALEADLAANPHPVLVAGDFNTSPAMADLDGLRDRLHDAATAGTDPLPASWPAGWALWRLDWTFTGPGWHAYDYHLLDPAGLSDHRAQDVLLSLEGA